MYFGNFRNSDLGLICRAPLFFLSDTLYKVIRLSNSGNTAIYENRCIGKIENEIIL